MKDVDLNGTTKFSEYEAKKYKWTVWVGGGEINDYLLTETEAHELAQIWKDKGYTEVIAEEIK